MSPRRGRFLWAVTVAIVLAASRAGAQENDECSTATVIRSVLVAGVTTAPRSGGLIGDSLGLVSLVPAIAGKSVVMTSTISGGTASSGILRTVFP